MTQQKETDLPQPMSDGLGAPIMGPRNVPLERENPHLLASPYTDAGTIPNLKFSFSGAIRELHWHKEAEWAYMLAGKARITAIDQDGRNFIDDLGVGDLWNFRAGLPHSIQALAEGCEFLLVFDDGAFSENETFLLVPGGRVRIVDSANFPAASTIAAALVEIDPGGMRELHWHPTNDEWQYYISGQGQMTVFASSGKARTFDYQAGDVGYVPFAMGHYVLNTGTEPLRFLEMFRSSRFADVSLHQWLALTPPELVRAHLNLDDSTMSAVTAYKGKPIITR
jgi:oxalate decarboxylase/phosphoglucose isomerase-like protein (cupin superfamily)